MPAMEPLSQLIGVDTSNLSEEENILLEAEFFRRICEKLREYHREENKDYFRSIKLTIEMEDAMLDVNFVRSIIKDILATEEYTLEGIAEYTDSHTDVVEEVLAGLNTSPSVNFVRKAIGLHSSVRRDLYNMIIKKAFNMD